MLVLTGWRHRVAHALGIPHRVNLETALVDFNQRCLDSGVEPAYLRQLMHEQVQDEDPLSSTARAFRQALAALPKTN